MKWGQFWFFFLTWAVVSVGVGVKHTETIGEAVGFAVLLALVAVFAWNQPLDNGVKGDE